MRTYVDLDIRLVLTSCQSKLTFVVKDSVPNDLRSHFGYKFTCGSCDARKPPGMLPLRFASIWLRSMIFTSANISRGQSLAGTCFSILDSAPTDLQLKIKETLQVLWERPLLSKQLQPLACYLLFLDYFILQRVHIILPYNYYLQLFNSLYSPSIVAAVAK